MRYDYMNTLNSEGIKGGLIKMQIKSINARR